MTPSLAVAVALLASGRAGAQEPPGAPAEPGEAEPGATEAAAEAEPPEDPIASHRLPFEVLVERTIGTASVPVAFDWRRSPVHLAATGSFLFELNNFESLRGGAVARLPAGGALLEVGLSYAAVWNSTSSALLSLTPYRQPGRPDRMEIDLALGLPLAEGVVTASPKPFPAVQMVFCAYAGFRYVLYPGAFRGMKPGQVAGAVFSPTLTDREMENLEEVRLAAMEVDPARYGLMLGLGNDVYFRPGLFLSPRMLLAVPVLAPATQTALPFWADFTVAVGVAL